MFSNRHKKIRRLKVTSYWAGIIIVPLTGIIFGHQLLTDEVALAQKNQTGNNNIFIGGDSNGDVNSNNITIGELNLIVDEKLGEIENSAQRQVALELASVLESLVRDGQILITPPAAQSLMDEVIQLAKKTPLKRDNIVSQQFELPAGRAVFLFGGRNRIAFKHWSWRGFATLSFNGNEIEVNFGGSVPFNHNGVQCELVLNGVNSRKRTADFTAFCGKG
ncbi:hypothetical protein [Hoeflea poritis]|uniref:Uncharacterized protein n=1 Tax=Hoeflea poritis TaxID=2993659 RepID=A0ABT4VLH3_9HYPH|nr:hypothetical protein [Hoeflea poritis]MDA4845570.1 hypothetical protein [Hoeflea poritis]